MAAIVGGILALGDYRHREVAEKAKWSLGLYEKLFEVPTYKEVRRKFDYDDLDEIKELISRDKEGIKFTEDQQIKFDQFTDYLNFFEFIAHLRALGQLTSKDIEAIFDYYLKLMTKGRNPEIREYLKRTGFENLDQLLSEYED